MARAKGKAGVCTRLGREYWRVVVEEWRRSGLGQAEFCRQHEIPRGSLSFWKYTLSREGVEASSPTTKASLPEARGPVLLPVRIPAPRQATMELPTSGAKAGSGEIEIVTHDGRLVRVRGRVEWQWLAEVLSMVESGRC